MPSWPQKGQADQRALPQVLPAFVNTGTVEEAVSILEQLKIVLLTDAASQLLQGAIESARREGLKSVNNLQQHQRLLERARVLGPQQADQKEQRHLDKVSDVVLAFMGASIASLRQVWEQHRSLLLTAEAIRKAKWAVKELQEDKPEEPWWHWGRELRVAYLKDARERGIDYAEQQFHQGMSEIITVRMREHFLGGSDL